MTRHRRYPHHLVGLDENDSDRQFWKDLIGKIGRLPSLRQVFFMNDARSSRVQWESVVRYFLRDFERKEILYFNNQRALVFPSI